METRAGRPNFSFKLSVPLPYVDHCPVNIHKDFKTRDSGRHVVRLAAAAYLS